MSAAEMPSPDDSSKKASASVPPLDLTKPLPVDHPAYPDISNLVIDDGAPVDGIYSEMQMRLLTESLATNWKPGRPFLAKANVGLFYRTKTVPIVPDVMLAVDVTQNTDFTDKQNNSWFVWDRGSPQVGIEVVSASAGGEHDIKPEIYARAGVPHYFVWDPYEHQSDQQLRYYHLDNQRMSEQPVISMIPDLELSLRPWKGEYENQSATWLRWYDSAGELIATGAESTDRERQRADREAQRAAAEAQRADQLAAELARLKKQPDG
ncbi:MAG: Uma2 family endonuclease [Planctomycetota bacterium]